MKPKIIAFYLPQYHPVKENDEWWGKGFTEWTNVGRAKPLFKGHNQPRVPTELGYYDLRLPIVREQQAQMARDAGVEGFCYWHYWFGNGRRLLSEVFQEVLDTGKPDFPFCLGWANHSWYAKTWDKNSQNADRLLIEQTYPGVEDAKKHFEFLIKAFKDPRYIKVEGKPLFYIFNPDDVPQEYIDKFKQWTVEYGLNGLFLVAQLSPMSEVQNYIEKGFDAVSYQRLANIFVKQKVIGHNFLLKWFHRITNSICLLPSFVYNYNEMRNKLILPIDAQNDVFPELVPQWDHTPRSGKKGTAFQNATPENFYLHVKHALEMIGNKKDSRQILFLKSWNEWGEGNMMEPDLTYGRGFIEALKKAIDEFS